MDPGDPEARIAALMDAHGASLLRTARHHSLCADDAHDALQRAIEIYLRKLDDVDVATEAAWLRVVVRHEAMAVRRLRSESVAGEEVDFDAREDDGRRTVEDRLFGTERSARSAEALRRLKPDEATGLMLKAEGLSYAEIGDRQGWTYTKTNRVITEGRRRFLRAYEELETKAACESFASALHELAQGTASAETVMALRPHLRHCPACRATVRELRGGRRRAAAWLPLPMATWLAGRRGRVLDAESNAIEAGGAATTNDPAAVIGASRWAEIKLQLHNLLHRFSGSDVAASVQIASTSGGGRATGVAALIGFCLSGVGAGTYCVATLVLPAEPAKPVERKAEERPDRRAVSRPKQEPPAQLISVAARATPVPTPRPARRTPRRTGSSSDGRSRSNGSGTTPGWEAPPASPAPEGQQEFSFESSAASSGAGSSQAAPAAAPTTGGGEFSP